MLEQAGRPPRLVVKDLPVPVPGPGEALVQVAACGFCHHDLLVMTGVLRRGVNPDIVLGHELAGQVVSVGEGVTRVGPGRCPLPQCDDSAPRRERHVLAAGLSGRVPSRSNRYSPPGGIGADPDS